ncbi:integrase [Skermanella stibiiresistens SB22]|uniref:Integrase n=2 Tax=Skermanella TaxID=204447 RepID=W9H8F7_9PROT|nr:integrase [Skermanella stibiiresistens SB22]
MQNGAYEAFRSIDVPEEKAVKAAAALSKRDDDVGILKADMSLLKWMMGFVLAFQIDIFLKMFIH